MKKVEKEKALRDKYREDILMSELLSCNHDLECINSVLRSFARSGHRGSGVDFTLEEIGLVLGITRERVRQIESSALRKLKSPKVAQGLRTYLYT